MTPYGKQSVWEFVFVRKYICFSSKLSRVFCSLKWATNLIISLYHHSSYPTKSFDCLAKSRLFWISREKFVLLQSTSWLSTHSGVYRLPLAYLCPGMLFWKLQQRRVFHPSLSSFFQFFLACGEDIGNYDVVYGTQGKADGRLARRCAFKKTNKLVQ